MESGEKKVSRLKFVAAANSGKAAAPPNAIAAIT